MKIKELHLKGWRSYSNEDGISVKGLKSINLFIGPNNSGKSNLFKYLYFLRENVIDKIKEKNIKYDIYNNLDMEIASRNTWADMNDNMYCEILLDEIKITQTTLGAVTLHDELETLRLVADHNTLDAKTCLSVLYRDDVPLLEKYTDSPMLYCPTQKCYVDTREGIGYPNETVEYWNTFFKSLVFVDPIRHYDRETPTKKESDFDGSDIIQQIIELHNDEALATEYMDYKDLIEECLKTILAEESVSIDVTREEVRFFLKRGDNRICAYLNQLGTGVSQIYMLLSFLYLNRMKGLNVFIEEPEGNLHPEALIQLLKIIEDRFTYHRFFISTHSSSLIDQVNDNWSIHQVYRTGNSPSAIVPCHNVIQQFSLLDNLGIRASQILQSNLVIWVEGPSDRIYIKKWIDDLTPFPLKFTEGRHYSFLMYGGANLTNYDLLGSQEKIDMLSTSRFAVVVCDSDKSEEESSLKRRVLDISESISRINQERLTSGIFERDSLLVWITQGREIENYVPHTLFNQVLFSGSFLRKYIYVNYNNGEKEKKTIRALDSTETEFKLYDSFDEYFASLYRFESGELLEPLYLKRIASDLSKNKNAIAKEITLNWDWDYANGHDLKEKIEDIVELIRKANGL